MTIDVDEPLDSLLGDDAPVAADTPGEPRPEVGRASRDGGGSQNDGGSGGGGHTRMARWAEKYDVRNSWQVIAGALLVPLGIVLILLGWYGAAHARVVQQQIPYMVSGSFVGLGCMIVGGFLFWGHWLYRIYDQADLHHEEQQRLLEVIAAALVAQRGDDSGVSAGGLASASAPDARTAGDVTDAVASQSPGTTFYATSSGTVYHRNDCAVIAHHPHDLRVLEADGIRGMQPCQICSPR